MIRKAILYLVLINISLVISYAQEVVVGLHSNYILKKPSGYMSPEKSKSALAILELPFFDDFPGHSYLPDKKLWSDDYVFINNTYSDNQNTKGMATFDALDNSGVLYSGSTSAGFEADHLTSQPVNLNYPASENIWLSFFYEPGGLSDLPETRDSLTLQFFSPGENKWYSVWRSEVIPKKRFTPVILKIDQSRYLQNGFRFRFINYASISPNLNDPSMVGNCDIWNVDYIRLDKNRNSGDTIFADVAYRLPLRSLLKSHEAMPWKQFKQIYLQEMGASIPVQYRNNDTITRNVTRFFEIRDVYKNTVSHFFSAGATNVTPLSNIGFNANLIYTYNTTNQDSALFKVTAILKTDEFDPKGNDTLVYFQKFTNYFAFDDGSAEAGYGINGLGSRNAMFAYRFRSYMEDTIRAIQICFNDSYQNSNKRSFDLMVWNDNNGTPGEAIYTLEEVMVENYDDVNDFYTYKLPDGVPVNGVFYIGWKQRSETFLNAGLDFNSPHKGKQLFWLNGEWSQSQVEGTVMIRPVVGDRLKITSVNDLFSSRKLITIWPNPASDAVNLERRELQITGTTSVTIIDLYGRELMNVPFSEIIDISPLHDGIYILITRQNGRPVGFNRLIKSGK